MKQSYKVSMNPPKPPMRRSILLLWIASVAMVVYLSLSPSLEIPYDFINADKIVHLLAYLWLATLPFFAFPVPKTSLAGALCMVPLSIGLEFAQHYVPGRCFSMADMAANFLGVMMGIWLAHFTKRHFLFIKSERL